MNRAERRASLRGKKHSPLSATVEDLGLKRSDPDPRIEELLEHIRQQYGQGKGGGERAVELMFNVLAAQLFQLERPPSEILRASQNLGLALPAVVKDYLTQSAPPPATNDSGESPPAEETPVAAKLN